ncbi:hypothetical protein, partial [Helicobacter ailurogastricus]|uniref:hypothetical protein n=1 Tax=Helicobacter ailurogastricus TaxID=1578720 RepID=UPI000AA27313
SPPPPPVLQPLSASKLDFYSKISRIHSRILSLSLAIGYSVRKDQSHTFATTKKYHSVHSKIQIFQTTIKELKCFLRMRNGISVLLVFLLMSLVPLEAYNQDALMLVREGLKAKQEREKAIKEGDKAVAQVQFKNAFEKFKSAYQDGEELGEVYLGLAYLNGEGVSKSTRRVEELFKHVTRKYFGFSAKSKSLAYTIALFGLAQVNKEAHDMNKALKYYKRIIYYNGGRWLSDGQLTLLALITMTLIFYTPIPYIKMIKLKNLKDDFPNAPKLRKYIGKTLYEAGMIYKNRNDMGKAREFLIREWSLVTIRL